MSKQRRNFEDDPYALDVVSLLNHVVPPAGERKFTMLYRQQVAAMFCEAGDKLTAVAISRWKMRGSIPIPHLLTLLRIAQERKVEVDLLDYAMPGYKVADFKNYDRAIKANQRARMEALIDTSVAGS